MAYELIETITVGTGGASSVEFANIPQDGKHLLLLLQSKTTDGSSYSSVNVTLNNSSVFTYKIVRLQASGTSVGTDNFAGTSFQFVTNGGGNNPNSFGNAELYFLNYAQATAQVVFADTVAQSASGNGIREFRAMENITTAATTSMQISYSNLAEHTTASLYKIS